MLFTSPILLRNRQQERQSRLGSCRAEWGWRSAVSPWCDAGADPLRRLSGGVPEGCTLFGPVSCSVVHNDFNGVDLFGLEAGPVEIGIGFEVRKSTRLKCSHVDISCAVFFVLAIDVFDR